MYMLGRGETQKDDTRLPSGKDSGGSSAAATDFLRRAFEAIVDTLEGRSVGGDGESAKTGFFVFFGFGDLLPDPTLTRFLCCCSRSNECPATGDPVEVKSGGGEVRMGGWWGWEGEVSQARHA